MTTARVLGPQRRLIALCSAALLVPLLLPLLTGRVFTKDDLGALHLPFRYLYREALRAGDSFLWTPAYRSGFYLHGEGEAGMAHPLHLVLYRLLPLGIAFNLEMISTYIAMLAGTGLLLRRLGLSAEAAAFGAMAFTFSGFNLFNLMHVNHIAAVAHVPWLLLGTLVLMTSADRKGRAWGFAGVALAVGSQLLVGNPQYVWLTLVVLGFMVLCLLYAGAPPARLLLLLGAWVLGTLIGAVQLLPTLDFARESTRVSWSLDQALSFSMSPLNLVQLWSPFAFRFRIHAPASESLIVHEFIVYNGAFCTMSLAWLAMRWRQQQRRALLGALLALAAISIVLAMGRYGGVYVWLAQLPGLRTLRAPSRHLVLFHLALSGIAAIAFEDLIGLVRRGERIELPRLWPLAVPVAVSVALTLLAGTFAQTSWAAAHQLSLSSVLRATPWSLLIGAAAVLIAMAARGIPWSVPVLIALVACDQGFWGYSYAYRWGPIQSVADLTANADVPPTAESGALIAPAIEGGLNNLAILRGFRLTPGYTGLAPASVLDPADARTQQVSGVAWRESPAGWVRLPDGMPRARLVSAAQLSADLKADLGRVDISRVALVDRLFQGSHDLVEASGEPALRGSVRIMEDRPGSIVLETIAPGRQIISLTERFHRGWQTVQDGVPRETLRLYGDYLGCVVDSGQHRVTFRFAPASARDGFRASLAGVGLTFAATIFFRRSGPRA